MAGDWIKMRADLAEDPAVIEMAAKLAIDEFCIVGRLHRLWAWADKHCATGHAKGVTFVWIDRHVCHNGFAECLQQVGWLDVTDTGIAFPRFDRHNGESAKKRLDAAERKRLQRLLEAKALETQESPTLVTSMSQEKRDEQVTREEKRREELSLKTTDTDVSVAASKPGVSLAGKDRNDCPHQEIVGLYHQVLPQCPAVRDWTPARRAHLRARWAEDKGRQSLDYWRRYFEYVASCPFLVGAAPATAGRKAFVADLEWLVTSANFTKVREGKYEQ